MATVSKKGLRIKQQKAFKELSEADMQREARAAMIQELIPLGLAVVNRNCRKNSKGWWDASMREAKRWGRGGPIPDRCTWAIRRCGRSAAGETASNEPGGAPGDVREPAESPGDRWAGLEPRDQRDQPEEVCAKR